MDRKIELNQISEEMFQSLMMAVSADVLAIGKEAQDKINELLIRFNIRCDLTLNYGIIPVETKTTNLIENLPTATDTKDQIESETPIKKKRNRKKRVSDFCS